MDLSILKNVVRYTSFEFMRHAILFDLLYFYMYFYCLYISIIYALPLTFFQTNVNLIYVPRVPAH